MGKKQAKKKAAKQAARALAGDLAGLPKKARPKAKCCISSDRCGRCPIRMLKDGTLPEGYTVKKRKLVKAAPVGVPAATALPTKPKKKAGKKLQPAA